MTLRQETIGRIDRAHDRTLPPPPDESAPLSSAPLAAVSDRWPDPPAREAFYGLAGEIVRTVESHTESDSAALLVQFLVAFGSAAGRGAGFRVEADFHGCNLAALVVGETSSARKGTSRRQATRTVELADPEWADRVTNGLVSGEGLIYEVRDPRIERRRARTKDEKARADDDGYIEEEIDAGIADKRCLVVESEFASTLRAARRETNTLSAVMRQAWDGGALRTMAKTSPTRATDAHVSVIGHITRDELRRELSSTEAANGFANRFLFVCARRSKELPEGGQAHLIDWNPYVAKLRDALDFARTAGALDRDSAARDLWARVYPKLSHGRPGLLGAVTARAEAQTMRLAVIYALLDRSTKVRAEHLQAALALWDYCQRSATYLFGDALGDRVADDILAELRREPDGLTRNELRNLSHRHKSAEEIGRALKVLYDNGLARVEQEDTGGRPAERWHAATPCAESAKSAERAPAEGLTAHTAHTAHPHGDKTTPEEDLLVEKVRAAFDTMELDNRAFAELTAGGAITWDFTEAAR